MSLRAALLVALLVAGGPLAIGYLGGDRTPAAPAFPSPGPTPPAPARGASRFTTTPRWAGVRPADRRWIEAAIARARPAAATLIRGAIGQVTFRTTRNAHVLWAGLTTPRRGRFIVTLNLWFLDRGGRTRTFLVLHELGHVVAGTDVPEGVFDRLAAEVPATGRCRPASPFGCVDANERFADTFAKWALRGDPSVAHAGYGLPLPASLERWGAPLGRMAGALRAAGVSGAQDEPRPRR